MYFHSANVLGLGEQMAFSDTLLQRGRIGRRSERRRSSEGKAVSGLQLYSAMAARWAVDMVWLLYQR